ncbi:U4 tri-snRNP-associated 2-like [Chlorella sorokiniana]|uniref:U4 tri-snRNP-associated 2-like n=1 Tax=Chlorella sorokiniana TaxID=3076 RepID=A0A2P6TZM0_CHLSO|nr:U4 tri-snRNP-associated 2-like [Chlorella sorokiniana]|eukprot:PRW59503.1 U4 tri-snRNP-associated 2-like [Chlorella sorokiniana]
MKRGRDQLEADGSEEGRGEQAAPAAAEQAAGGDEQERQQQQQPGDGQQPPAQQAEEDDEDDKPLLQNYKMSKSLRKGIECPYLDTISRQNLDFDFEKCCSVSLSGHNVYACLVCGKYFQGRGPNTQAYTHALEAGHHMFMKVEDGRVYCLPDMYEVQDRSLADIQYVLNPTFTPEEVAKLDSSVSWARALDGTEYMPGLVGLNNMKQNDYANVVVQALIRIHPIRDFFLRPENYKSCNSLLVQRFGELVRKTWNPRAFKGQVSPHEFMQAVMSASGKRFIIDQQSDPVEFLSWLVNTLHHDLTGGKRKKRSVITDCLQGELEVVTLAGTGKAKDSTQDVTDRVPFLMLGLDLPAAPLFKDALEKVIIPQVPIFDILKKFDGQAVSEDIKHGRRRFRITKLPRFLVVHVRRFLKNQFFMEKNPTIVNFPVKNLELAACVPVPQGKDGQAVPSKYDLVANLVHEGKAGQGQGTYRVHVHRKVEEQWYEVQDLRVSEVLPQMVALSETYAQVYELKQ